MNLITLLQTLAYAVYDDPDIQQWGQDNYQRIPTVFVGYDINNPPPAEVSPVVIFGEASKNSSQGEDESPTGQPHAFTVVCELEDRTTAPMDKDRPGVTEYRGAVNIEAFRKLVETRIVATMEGLSPAFETIALDSTLVLAELFPWFQSFDVYEGRLEYLMGSDLFG